VNIALVGAAWVVADSLAHLQDISNDKILVCA
jgi:hypothetical protein